jgi:hypothetical protein
MYIRHDTEVVLYKMLVLQREKDRERVHHAIGRHNRETMNQNIIANTSRHHIYASDNTFSTRCVVILRKKLIARLFFKNA